MRTGAAAPGAARRRNENDVRMTTAGLWRYGDWRHVATGCTALVASENRYEKTHNRSKCTIIFSLGFCKCGQLKQRSHGRRCPFGGGQHGFPPNTMWPGPRPTRMPSFILIRPILWPQCTNVTDRTDRTGQTGQRSDSIGRTVLQTVAQKCSDEPHNTNEQ